MIELIEWSGPSVSGKTQLAFLTCLCTAASFSNGNVYYIDSGANFSGKRLSQLWDHSLELSHLRKARTKRSVFERIIKLSAYDHIGLKSALKDLQRPILVVIDSISDLLLPIASLKGQQMYSIVQLLKAFAESRNVPIIAINGNTNP
jgi:predicted ATP-dependent serine protease